MYLKKILAVAVTALMIVFSLSSIASAESQQPPERCFYSNQTFGYVANIYAIVQEKELDRNTLQEIPSVKPRIVIKISSEANFRGEDQPRLEEITIYWFSKMTYGPVYGLCIENNGVKQWLNNLDAGFQKILFQEIRKIAPITDRIDTKE